MASNREFEDGVPKTFIDTRSPLDGVQELFGNFASTVLYQVKQTDSNAPNDSLTFGDNWFQLVVSKDQPTDDFAKAFQEMTTRMGLPNPFFADMWQIMLRSPQDDINAVMVDIEEGVRAGTLDRRVLDKMAVIDLTKAAPVLRREDLQEPAETPWGTIGRLRGIGTLIYHITSGYARQIPVNLGSPSSDSSTSLHLFGPMKW